MRSRICVFAWTALAAVFSANICFADTVPYFEDVHGDSSGSFAWDEFTGAYEDNHSPDQGSVGTGSSILFASEAGGMLAGTNLYSFFSVPTWNISVSGADDSLAYTSVAVQIATSALLEDGAFTLGGVTPDEFIELGSRGPTGYNFYWAEWQGLTAESDFSVAIQGTGAHQALSGAQLTYFNTSSSYNINAVPEPSSAMALVGLSAASILVRRRRK